MSVQGLGDHDMIDENGYKKIIETLISLINEGVYIVDENGSGLFYNKAMELTEKISANDVIGRKFVQAFPGIKLSDSTMFKALNQNKATKNLEQTYTNLHGKQVTTVNNTRPVTIDGKVIAAVEVANDITDIRYMSDAILELKGDSAVETEPQKPKLRRYTFEDIIGVNKEFVDVVNRARRAAENDASVFIYGETGTGKELFAQSIHYAGRRSAKPMLAQNCAAMPESLLEGILFGTSKGGFTGAVDRAGMFEQASGGTLLLDEINAMPYDLQSKLLRVLQEDYIRRVGGVNDIPVDVRIIATVNEPPQKLIEENRLRKDLYYRLNVVNLTIPPLRVRIDDIPLLTDRFLDKYNKKYEKEIWMASEAAMDRLSAYDYPGNVRELENIISSSVSMMDGNHVLTEKMLQMPVNTRAIGEDRGKWNERIPLNKYLEDLEKEIIREAMANEGANITRAARDLGIKRQTLQHKLRKYDITG